MKRTVNVSKQDNYCVGQFDAMASPCELLIDNDDETLALALTRLAADEAWRIQDKFSRYDPHSLCSKINQSNGKAVDIDGETFQLLTFAAHCYQMSDGLFDITSGILRKVWRFDGSDNLPKPQAIDDILQHIGWEKVRYDRDTISLPSNMEIDFGGIGKEYAVDRVCQMLRKSAPGLSILVNFGGDLAITQPRENQQSWTVGIENPNIDDKAKAAISISKGALATSGDARRYLVKEGKRYGHILNPKTGWPIENAPRSVTVAAPQCVTAGMLSTMSLLCGAQAKEFLDAQDVEYWCF